MAYTGFDPLDKYRRYLNQRRALGVPTTEADIAGVVDADLKERYADALKRRDLDIQSEQNKNQNAYWQGALANAAEGNRLTAAYRNREIDARDDYRKGQAWANIGSGLLNTGTQVFLNPEARKTVSGAISDAWKWASGNNAPSVATTEYTPAQGINQADTIANKYDPSWWDNFMSYLFKNGASYT